MYMTSQTSVLNGVNVEQLVGTINAIKEDPTIADFKFKAQTMWGRGSWCKTEIQSFTGANQTDTSRKEPFVLVGDEPPVLLGNNLGANAVEALLHALGSCLTVGFVYNAAARGIAIKPQSLSFDIEGDLNLHAFLGLSDTIRPGYSNIRVKVNIDTDASKEEVEELLKYVEKTSPVVDCIRNPVPISFTLA